MRYMAGSAEWMLSLGLDGKVERAERDMADFLSVVEVLWGGHGQTGLFGVPKMCENCLAASSARASVLIGM